MDFKIWIIFLLIAFIAALLSASVLAGGGKPFYRWFLESLISILLLPIFFTVAGNDIIQDILSSKKNIEYHYILLFAYSIIAGLAGNRLISKTLISVGLTHRESNSILQDITSLKESQKNIIRAQITKLASDLKTPNSFQILQYLNTKDSSFQSIPEELYQEELIRTMEQEVLIIRGPNNNKKKTYKLTSIGLDYLENFNT